jgi:hypothetical protein
MESSEDEDDVAQERRHLDMARWNLLAIVVSDVCDHAKRRGDTLEEQESNMAKARRSSIRSEMARRRYAVAEYSSNSDGSDGSNVFVSNSAAPMSR